jgi:hypothetical protein
MLSDRARAILDLDSASLYAALASGQPVDPEELRNSEYKGISLNMPGFVDRFFWKTFKKVFCNDLKRGVLRGWNVRLEQEGVDAPCRPKSKNGAIDTFGHYVVRPASEYGCPVALGDGAVMLDYGLGGNRRMDLVRPTRDPVVAIEKGSSKLLLGWSYMDLGIMRMRTPSFFLLVFDGPLMHHAEPPLVPLGENTAA